jgi:hypothetical protein
VSAIISDCGKYRYELRRKLKDYGRQCLFIMLNPSTADASLDDPTIRRCKGFAQTWECGELIVCNLFAYRATNPKELYDVPDPVGTDNKGYLQEAAEEVQHAHEGPGIIVCAWGAHGEFMDQGEAVMGWLDNVVAQPKCLGVTKDGHPKHPLYLPSNSELVLYSGIKEQP